MVFFEFFYCVTMQAKNNVPQKNGDGVASARRSVSRSTARKTMSALFFIFSRPVYRVSRQLIERLVPGVSLPRGANKDYDLESTSANESESCFLLSVTHSIQETESKTNVYVVGRRFSWSYKIRKALRDC